MVIQASVFLCFSSHTRTRSHTYKVQTLPGTWQNKKQKRQNFKTQWNIIPHPKALILTVVLTLIFTSIPK